MVRSASYRRRLTYASWRGPPHYVARAILSRTRLQQASSTLLAWRPRDAVAQSCKENIDADADRD
jgi:hypothetical protein